MGDRNAYVLALATIPDQLERVHHAMRSGRWWTKAALAQAVGGSPHAMSARMSDLRKAGALFEKHHQGNGLYLYRMTKEPTTQMTEPIIFTDRYAALGRAPNGCKGQCEGTGVVPVNVKGPLFANPYFRAAWYEAERKKRTTDGWHFVRCPDCN